MAWVEGLTNSDRLLKDMANILCTANKDESQLPDDARNWSLVYPKPFDLVTVTDEILISGDNLIFTTSETDLYDQVPLMIKTLNGDDVTDPFTVNYTDGIITFEVEQVETLTLTYQFMQAYKIQTGLAKITNRIVLKTTTTLVTPDSSEDPYGSDTDSQISQITMYLEIIKPIKAVNPETGSVSSYNNDYYIQCRVFDVWDDVAESHAANEYDISGVISKFNSHVSEWANFSWYRYFSELLKDALDDTPGTTDLERGMTYDKMPNAGVFGTMTIQFYISCNNDRIAMVLVGDPTLSYDDYMISFAYVGTIDSFEDSTNDTAGNFAITTGSSVVPCYINNTMLPISTSVEGFGASSIIIDNSIDVAETPDAYLPNLGSATTHTVEHKVSYTFVPVGPKGGNGPIAVVEALYSEQYTQYIAVVGSLHLWKTTRQPTDYSNFQVTFSGLIPENAAKIAVYRKNVAVFATTNTELNISWPVVKAQTSYSYIGEYTPEELYTFGFVDSNSSVQDLSKKPPTIATNYSLFYGVKRDPLYGNVVAVKYPNSWGEYTATGVSDIAMYKTRNGAYYQRHYISFIATEEGMVKDSFSPSRWTNKFHLSPAYVVHGYDGYRGWLKDVIVVDDASIIHLDKLIVNKDSVDPEKPEETYRYFKINTPYSFLTNTPNFHCGIAIKEV